MSPETIQQLTGLWHNWYFQDVLVSGLLMLSGWIGYVLWKRPYWRSAVREFRQRRMAVAAFVILLLYGLVAVLDSVGWHPALRDHRGQALVAADGAVLHDQKGLSVLDAMLTPLRNSREKTYSAPLASRQFTAEVTPAADGSATQEYPGLRHPGAHLLGTDQVGEDVLYQAFKGIRTGFILGMVTTLLVIPFAILFGVVAGYFGGWVDDLIQYLYTVLASIPAILLIMAFVVIFGRGLPQLCIVLGITAWTGTCRVLRGETMKLREMEFIQSAEAMCVPRHRIIWKHLIPNVMHVVIISSVLGFSGRVLIEAALTYIGCGVGADTYSWGKMINDARMEMARDPVIWWKLSAAFVLMVGLVLPANLFGDAVRDALDPKLRTQ